MRKQLFGPIKTKRIFEEVADNIKTLIIDGTVKPGDKLPSELELARQFRVSRQTVREALRLLELSGFVRIKRGANGGPLVEDTVFDVINRLLLDSFRMRNITIQDFTKARMGIERAIMDAAIDNATDSDIEELQENINRALKKVENGELATYENVRFHKLLAKASKNQVFLIVIECMQAVYRDFLLRCYIDMDITRFVIRCNAGILAAIKEKNRKKAEDCLEKKLLMLSKNIIPYEDKDTSDQNLANAV